ncbi:MAG: helix-turn-helix domain-containing protein [Verrucomicrobiales bacterium]|nr:helix-turn-helix domain-containing protein [Verrucomicrobiales bacterium]
MPRVAAPVFQEPPDRLELERWVAAHGTSRQVTQRCRILLAAATGARSQEVAQEFEINPKTVALWRTHFCCEGTDCLWEVAEGRGRKPRLAAQDVERIVEATLQTKPAGATHWDCRTRTKAQGIRKATVNRVSLPVELRSPTLRVDGNDRFDRGKVESVQSDAGDDRARLHSTENAQNKGESIQSFVRHYTGDRSRTRGKPSVPRFRSYSMKGNLGGRTNEIQETVLYAWAILEPANLFVFIDEHQDSIGDAHILARPAPDDRWVTMPADRHGQVGGLGLSEGHVERWHRRHPKEFSKKVSYWKKAENSADLLDLQRVQSSTLASTAYIRQR